MQKYQSSMWNSRLRAPRRKNSLRDYLERTRRYAAAASIWRAWGGKDPEDTPATRPSTLVTLVTLVVRPPPRPRYDQSELRTLVTLVIPRRGPDDGALRLLLAHQDPP